jgi:alpha-L-arabinofuranosidase
MPHAEAAGITFLRFPGGEWGDQHDLRDYQIDPFIELARRMGAEPQISVRMPGGSPQAAAELVRYCNLTHDYGVRFWAIGNEPTLYTSYNFYEDYDTARYNREWREFAEAMKAVDPNILLLGPEPHQYTGNPGSDPHDEAGRDWMREFLLANGDLVDIVAIHRYPFPTSMDAGPTTIDELRANAREWDTIIPNLRALIRETTGRDLPIAVTEVNSDWTHAIGGEATPDSFYNAVWWADVLGRMIRQGVDIVAYFLLQCKSSQGGWGLLDKYDVRPTYYVYSMYQRFGGQLLYASSDDPDVSVYAARREDGAVTVILVNLGPEEKTKPLMLENTAPTEPAEVWLFDSDHPAERVSDKNVHSGSEVVLPPQSVSLYVIR